MPCLGVEEAGSRFVVKIENNRCRNVRGLDWDPNWKQIVCAMLSKSDNGKEAKVGGKCLPKGEEREHVEMEEI